MTLRKITVGSALLCMAHATSVQAAQAEECLSVAEAEALVTYLLPKAVKASRTQCADSLPVTAPLLMENSEQFARYSAASDAAWPQAKAAVNVIAGDDLPGEISDEIMRPIADVMFTQMISAEIKPQDCALIAKIYSDLEPLPSSNLSSIVVALVQAATKDDEKQDIPICQSVAG